MTNRRKALMQRIDNAEALIESIAQVVTEQGKAIKALTDAAAPTGSTTSRKADIVLHRGHLRVLQTFGLHTSMTPQQAVASAGYTGRAAQSYTSDLKALGLLANTGHLHNRAHLLAITSAGRARLIEASMASEGATNA